MAGEPVGVNTGADTAMAGAGRTFVRSHGLGRALRLDDPLEDAHEHRRRRAHQANDEPHGVAVTWRFLHNGSGMDKSAQIGGERESGLG